MTSSEPDEVIGEIDVLLSQPPEHADVHVLQYPLRHPSQPPGTDRKIISAQQRPRAGRLQLSLSVYPDNETEEGATSASSFDETQEGLAAHGIGSTQVLRSRPHRAAPDANFAIGRYDEARNAFVIVPIVSVTQMRPAFDYLDKFDMRQLQARLAEKTARADALGEPAEDVSAVQMSFRRRETERAAERRKNSHATLRQMEESEPWQNLTYEPMVNTGGRREQLFRGDVHMVKQEEQDAFDVATDYEALFRLHTRHVALGNVAKSALDVNRFSVASLRALPISSAVTQIFAHARLLHFRDVCELLPEADERQVMKSTRAAAICLRGCWVMKKGQAEIGRRAAESGGGKSGRGASERHDAARFLVLDLFRQSRVVRTADAEEAIGKPMPMSEASLQRIFEEVGRRRPGLGWEFKLEDDIEFEAEYGELWEAQEADWERRVKAARETVAKSLRTARLRV